MKHLSLYLLFAIAIQSFCCADVAKFAPANPSSGGLSAEDRKLLLDSSRFHEVHNTTGLPPVILALCDVGSDGKLAEPGQKWNATDAVSDPTLPAKRLIWGAIGGEHYVVHYERGGIAYTYHILVVKRTKADEKLKVVWNAIGGPFRDYASFLDALRTGNWTTVWITRIERSSSVAIPRRCLRFWTMTPSGASKSR